MLDKIFQEMVLRDCNKKINELNEIGEYLSQYSRANMYIISNEYKETITNQLSEFQDQHPLLFFKVEDNHDGTFSLLLFNHGVLQREQVIAEMKKND